MSEDAGMNPKEESCLALCLFSQLDEAQFNDKSLKVSWDEFITENKPPEDAEIDQFFGNFHDENAIVFKLNYEGPASFPDDILWVVIDMNCSDFETDYISE